MLLRPQVTLREGDTACALEISVAAQDIGKVVGRQGRTIAAICTLVHAAGAKERKHVLVDIAEGRSRSWSDAPS
ncbi:MAG: KH domain-containing protein [Candidatus Tectomicrobia bacterium]